MAKLTKEEKASKARLLAVRLPWIQEMLKKDKKIRIGPIFPEKDRVDSDVSDRPRVGIYRKKRQLRDRIASASRQGRYIRIKGLRQPDKAARLAKRKAILGF